MDCRCGNDDDGSNFDWMKVMILILINDYDPDDQDDHDEEDDDMRTSVVTLPCGRDNPILWRVRDVAW